MSGGGSIEIPPSMVSKTKEVFEQTKNYLEISDRSYSYYTKVAFSKDMTQIANWANYGLNPSLYGIFIERFQPYVIYLVMYYYVSIIFSQLFNRNNNIYLYKKQRSNIDLIDKDDISFSIDTEYYIYASIQLMDNVMILLTPKSNIVIKFKFTSTNADPLLVILDIYIVSQQEDTTPISSIIEQLTNNNLKSVRTVQETFISDDIRRKTLNILKTTISLLQRIISKQSSATMLQWIIFNTEGLYTLNEKHTGRFFHKIDEYINSNFIIVLSNMEPLVTKALDTSETSGKSTSSQTSKTNIVENPIPSVLNIYLSSTDPKIDNTLLTLDMLIPGQVSKDKLRINPRNPLKDMKSILLEFCKTNKITNPIIVFFDKELFSKFNSLYRKKTNVRTLKQAIETNVPGNISTTIQLLLSGSELQIANERLQLNNFFWNNQWYLTGPRDVLLSIDPTFLQSEVDKSPTPTNNANCYSEMLDVLSDLVDLFYPSMAGKDISIIYNKYLQGLNERNALIGDIKHLIDKEQLSISTTTISDKHKDTISAIRVKSISLKNIMKKFIQSVIYQLVIIVKIITKIINRIQTRCFVYYTVGHDFDVKEVIESGPSENVLVTTLSRIIPLDEKTLTYLSFLDEVYDKHSYLDRLSCSLFMKKQYSEISQTLDTVINTVISQLTIISQRMITVINNDNSNTTVNLSNERFDAIWISNQEIEAAFTSFEKSVKLFISSNLLPEYYSQENIETFIDSILWDMDMSDSYTYSRLVTSFVDSNIWVQVELLFAMKTLQYIFLIYKYTGKYISYYNVDITKLNISTQLENFILFISPVFDVTLLKRLNLFSYVINWFKYICCKQIQLLITTKNGNITIYDIRNLFKTNTMIKQSYIILRYFLINIILLNIDVCQLSNELQSLIGILAPTDTDLKQYTHIRTINPSIPQQSPDNTKPPLSQTKPKDDKPLTSETDLAFNVIVQVSATKIETTNPTETTGKLEGVKSTNINSLLGCKKLSLGMKWEKLKHSTNEMVGKSIQKITNKVGGLFDPNLSIITDDLSTIDNSNKSEKSEKIGKLKTKTIKQDSVDTVLDVFKNPQYQILDSIPEFVIKPATTMDNKSGSVLGIDLDKFILEITELEENPKNKSLTKNDKSLLQVSIPLDYTNITLSELFSSFNSWKSLM